MQPTLTNDELVQNALEFCRECLKWPEAALNEGVIVGPEGRENERYTRDPIIGSFHKTNTLRPLDLNDVFVAVCQWCFYNECCIELRYDRLANSCIASITREFPTRAVIETLAEGHPEYVLMRACLMVKRLRSTEDSKRAFQKHKAKIREDQRQD